MRALIAGPCLLLLAASAADAESAAPSRHAKASLTVPVFPAEPLQAHPRIPVRIEKLVDGMLAELMRGTDAAHRDAVKTIALNICGNSTMPLADCLGMVVRMNVFLEHDRALMEAANQD